jgi:hypothetical protein
MSALPCKVLCNSKLAGKSKVARTRFSFWLDSAQLRYLIPNDMLLKLCRVFRIRNTFK